MVGRILLLALLITSALANAQSTTIVGTCDQYQPSSGGDYCINTGSGTYWQHFGGDVSNYRDGTQCSSTNTASCGKLTVKGVNGIPFNGTLTDGQTWCYHAADNTMIPCAP